MSDAFTLFGTNLFGDAIQPAARGPVAEAFVEPPFTVLDARSGEWQDRKSAWAAMGIQGEIGRDRFNYCSEQALELAGGYFHADGAVKPTGNTSCFDPVVCELAYRWFCPPGGQVLNPFAGGSVRGIVAGALGRKYWGCDLRTEQIEANERQADEIQPSVRPTWICGDSRETVAYAPEADLLFTCPPYGNLERYSDDLLDLSAMSWTGFVVAYRLILHRAAAKLKQDRFACVVVGNFRDTKTGHYRDLVGETVAAMREAGLGYYNEAVLVTSVGSASMRVTKQFNAGRKLCKTHQNVLVFVKGDWRRAAQACS